VAKKKAQSSREGDLTLVIGLKSTPAVVTFGDGVGEAAQVNDLGNVAGHAKLHCAVQHQSWPQGVITAYRFCVTAGVMAFARVVPENSISSCHFFVSEADAALAEFIAKYSEGAFLTTEVYAFRGETDRAFSWLEWA